MSIAVIIPAYNASSYLAETLESALRQSLRADDILVVDDGSTDDTAAIAASFPSPVRVLSIPNSKLGAARNFGVSQVQTEWIAFLDADDLWKENKLELQMEELAKRPEADICYTGHISFKKAGDNLEYGSGDEVVSPDGIAKSLYRMSTFLPSSVIIRRSALLRIGGFSPDPGVAEDWDLWLRLLHAGVQFAACREPLLYYRVHKDSITANKAKTLLKDEPVFKRHILPQLPIPRRWFALANFYSMHEFDIACSLREQGDAGCLRVMTRSILKWPFGEPKRYKVWLHMALTRLGLLRRRASSK